LYRRQGVVICLLVKEPLRLLEEVVACRLWVFRISPGNEVGGKTAAKGKQGIDK
jgi:hypothetical protein